MLFQIPHGGWAILTIFTVSQADAGASLQRGGERLLGTIAGGIAGLLAIIAFIDLPYVFAPALGLAVVAGVYLSHVMAAPYPPLLGVMTYVLVTLSHVEFPEDYVDVALWRIVAIGMGVVLGTGAQLFLWPDDPIDKLRAGAGPPPAPGAIARRSGHRALGDRAGPAVGGDADARGPDDGAAAPRQCRSAPRASPSPPRRAHRAHPRGRAALHLGALGGRDDAGHDGTGRTRRRRPRAAPGDQRGERAAGPRAREPARAARLDRPDGHHPRRGGSGPGRRSPGARPRRDGALARPDRIPDRRSPPGRRFPLGAASA